MAGEGGCVVPRRLLKLGVAIFLPILVDRRSARHVSRDDGVALLLPEAVTFGFGGIGAGDQR